MKTIKKIFIAIAMCLIGVVLTGCFNDTVQTLTIETMPNTTFKAGTTKIKNLMTIIINEGENQYRLTLGWSVENNLEFTNEEFEGKIKLENFDLTEEGNRTASIKYNSAVSYFDYQVVSDSSLFAGGNGSPSNPYQITSARQFLNINNLPTTKDKYFKLMNDIDLSGIINESDLKIDFGWRDSLAMIETFEGVLDGNNKKLYNINYNGLVVTLGEKEITNPGLYVFGELSGATLKDLDVYINGSRIGLSLAGNSYNNRPLNFSNVDMYGNISSGKNYGGYYIYTATFKYESVNVFTGKNNETVTGRKYVYSTVNFNNCDSYVTNIASNQDYVAVFVAIPIGDFTFNGCWNHGYIEAISVAVFFCNGYWNTIAEDSGVLIRPASESKYTIINSGNDGTLSYVQYADGAQEGIIAVSGTNLSAKNDSSTVTLGNIKQMPKFEFDTLARLDATSKVLSFDITDSSITEIQVNLYFQFMSYTDEYSSGTTNAYLTRKYSVKEAANGTHIRLETLGSSEKLGSIKINRTPTGETTGWLVYDEVQKAYVFDGTKARANAICTGGTPWISVFAYNAKGEVVSAYMAKLTEVK